MLAQQFGMIGLIIYSDPADDGYVQGPVFPNGPWRSNSSVQRGSVQFLSICAGDPRNVECAIDPKTYNYTQVLPAIPVQPISYSDATPILMGLNGTLPNSSWQVRATCLPLLRPLTSSVCVRREASSSRTTPAPVPLSCA